jgi:integrase
MLEGGVRDLSAANCVCLKRHGGEPPDEPFRFGESRSGMRPGAEGRRLYLTEEERRAFIAAAAKAPREVRTFCGVLHATGCRISEALALTADRIDLAGRVIVFESLKKRKRSFCTVSGALPPSCAS